MNRQPLCLLFARCLVAPLVYLSVAASQLDAAGTTGADVLRLRPDARAWALGMSGTGLLDLAGTPDYNPASLGLTKRQALSFLHYFAFPDVASEQFVFRRPTEPLGTLAGGLLYRHQEPIDNVQGETPFSVSDTVLAVYCGRRHGENLFYGLGLKGLILKLGDDYAYGLATDLGLAYRVPGLLDLGLALRNVGPGVKFKEVSDPLPLMVNGGVARQFAMFGGRGDGTLLADLDVGRDGEIGLGMGLEAGRRGSWLVRAGYRMELGRSFSEGPSLGFGLARDFGVFQVDLDYSCRFIYFELGGYDYEPEHLLGFTVFFGPVPVSESTGAEPVVAPLNPEGGA